MTIEIESSELKEFVKLIAIISAIQAEPIDWAVIDRLLKRLDERVNSDWVIVDGKLEEAAEKGES